MLASPAMNKESPNPALSKARVSNGRDLRTSSRLRASQLPLPVQNVNKTTKAKVDSKAKNKPKDAKKSIISTSAASTKGAPIYDAEVEGSQGRTHVFPVSGTESPPDMSETSPGRSPVTSPSNESSAGRSPVTLPSNEKNDQGNVPLDIPPPGDLDNSKNIDIHANPPAHTGAGSAGEALGDLQTDLPGSKLPPSSPSDPWHLAYTELKIMGQSISKLDNIERDVAALKGQFAEISGRTKVMEGLIQGHTADIQDIKASIAENTTNFERHDTSLDSLWTYTDDIASKADQRIREIKEAIQENINKIEQIGDIKAEINKAVSAQIKESLQTFKNEIKREFGEQLRRNSQNLRKEINDIINRNSHDIAYKNLQDQAYYNRHNLVFLGIPEHESDSAFTQALNFCKSSLHFNKPSIDVAYRLGIQPPQDSTYTRPIVVKFSKISDRNSVWMKRNNISQDRRGKPIRIQADIPKQLREDLQILYRVKNAALHSNQYQTVEVKNYRLYLDGAEYCAWELEELPISLRPSTLATRISHDTLVFYSKHSVLSNHHTSPFEVRGRSYANMEQYLAYKRAKLSGQKPLIQKALHAQDPVEAKSILNTLRSDHYDEWKKELPTIALEGLQAKFRQNPTLAEYLRNTTPLTLGEASTNPQWGVGMALENDSVLDKTKWNKQGNLLGRSLMTIREQLIKERKPATTVAPERKSANQNKPMEKKEKEKEKTTTSAGDRAQPANKPSNQSSTNSSSKSGERKGTPTNNVQ